MYGGVCSGCGNLVYGNHNAATCGKSKQTPAGDLPLGTGSISELSSDEGSELRSHVLTETKTVGDRPRGQMLTAFLEDEPVGNENGSEDTYGYRIDHTAPNPSSGAPMSSLENLYPLDFYGNPREAARLYGGGDMGADLEVVKAVQAVRNNPEEIVTAYRAVPHGVNEINPGDWVTPSKSYAEQHGMHPTDPSQDWPVISLRVRAGDLYTNGDSLNEWGWSP